MLRPLLRLIHAAPRRAASSAAPLDDAFEMAASTLRFGPGVTAELGLDVAHMGAKRVCLMTDAKLAKMAPVRAAMDSLTRHGIAFDVFDDVGVEPTDTSVLRAVDFARKGSFDAYVAVGGGSVMDTCKIANLFACCPNAELLDYVNAPIGRAQPVEAARLRPLIAVPTTSGTGSETSGTAIFDYTPLRAKTGISHRALRPTLGLLDPQHTLSLPRNVTLYAGLDVLCHALESYTALHYTRRGPRPAHPLQRPAYQGSNPLSDVWALHALNKTANYLQRAVNHPDDFEARCEMHLAAAMAGVGFGNAGVHLCHGLSYGISGNVKDFRAKDYPQDKALVPHGLSVIISAPAVFEFTAPACPERHLEAAAALGVDVSRAKAADAGKILSDWLRRYMKDVGIEDGICQLGYTAEDIPGLVEATLPQHRVTKLSPRPVDRPELTAILENSLSIY